MLVGDLVVTKHATPFKAAREKEIAVINVKVFV